MHFAYTSMLISLFRYVCKVTVMDRDDWMYKTSRLDLSFLENVRKKFIPFAQKHHLSLGRDRMICPCNDYKNRLA
jgi:hypothetical protein